MKSRQGKIKALPKVRVGPRLEARLRVGFLLIRRGRHKHDPKRFRAAPPFPMVHFALSWLVTDRVT